MSRLQLIDLITNVCIFPSILLNKFSGHFSNGLQELFSITVLLAVSVPTYDVSQYVHDSVANVSHLPTINDRVQR